MTQNQTSLYNRLGGYDGVTTFVNELLPRLQGDSELGRFWKHRGSDGVAREKQLLIDYLCSNTDGPVYYTGRTMKLSHEGMKISDNDWSLFFKHAGATMEALQLPKKECDEIVAFVTGLKEDIVEV